MLTGKGTNKIAPFFPRLSARGLTAREAYEAGAARAREKTERASLRFFWRNTVKEIRSFRSILRGPSKILPCA